jgi:tripartite-type tricarboxylate transporter receptor subunit TctC
MSPRRRTVLLCLPAAAYTPARLLAQAYPSRTIRVVVPFAPGGGPDVLARQYLPRMSAILGQTAVVDNRVGAGGIIAAEHVAQQPGDGYTLLVGASSHLTQKLIKPNTAYDPLKSFRHITRLSYSPSLLVVGAGSPYQSLDDIYKAARQAPGKLNYGTSGIGSVAHLAGATVVTHGKVDVSHIPYRSAPEVFGALNSGDIAFSVLTAASVEPMLGKGPLRALAITSAQREASLPGLPTLKELTHNDDLVQVSWSGIWVPASTPTPVVTALFDAFTKVYSDPEIAKANSAIGVNISLSASPAEFSDFVASELAKYGRIVKSAHIEAN